LAVRGTYRVAILIGSTRAVSALTWKNGNGRVDKGHERGKSCIGVVVDGSHLGVKIELQRVDRGRRNVRHGQSGDEMKIGGGVVWLETVRNDITFIKAKTKGDGSWNQFHNLTCRTRSVDNEWVVQAVVETNLDKSCVLWLVWNAGLRLNHLWHVCWNTSDSG